MHIAVIDIGKVENLGWAIEGPNVNKCGTNIDAYVDALAEAQVAGPLALGFEAPMYVPYREDVAQLDRCRDGERDRAFSASAGACVLVKGLVICPYILAALRKRAKEARITFDWKSPLSKNDILLFEAFVTHEAADHVGCAKKAIESFKEAREGQFKSALGDEPCLNLLAAMLLHTRWTDDIQMLHEQCLVIRHRGTR